MQLLEDTFIIENLQIINEGAGSGPMKIRGCFQRADEENNNKRIYSKPLLEREITKLAESISERRLLGELDHPQHDSVRLSNVSHLITDLKMKGSEVIGEAEILNTPSGKVAQALIEGGVKVGISSRGMGTVSEDVDGKRHVNEDFKLITWDLVADPSTRGAYPGLTESTQIQDIIDRVYPEAQKVNNFTTLLKEELISEVTNKAGGDKPSEKDVRARLGRAATRSPRVASTTYSPASLEPAEMEALRTPAEKRADEVERQKAIRAAQNSSTQFVNFMRDKLMEEVKPLPTARSVRRSRKAALTSQHQSEIKTRASERRISFARPRKSRTMIPVHLRQHSSTQFINFMRDKLMEMEGEFDTRQARFGTGPSDEEKEKMAAEKDARIEKQKARKAASKADLARRRRARDARDARGERRGWRPGDPGVVPESERDDSSTQFVNFMRDRLSEVSTALARRAALDHNEWYKEKKRAKLSSASRAELDRRIAARKKAEGQEYHTPQQHSSTQLVNFMRDKLMEVKKKDKPDKPPTLIKYINKK